MAHDHAGINLSVSGGGIVAGIIAGGETCGVVAGIIAGRVDIRGDDALAGVAGAQPVRPRGGPLRAATVISGGSVVVNGGSGAGRAAAPGGAPAALSLGLVPWPASSTATATSS
jgi:hypothetical protein